MMNSLKDVNWGFDPTGAGLGGESSPSMPGDADLGMDNPMELWRARLGRFTQGMERSYGGVGNVNDALWTAQGGKQSGMLNAIEHSAAMSGGEPVPGDFAVRTRVRRAALEDPNTGLSAQGAASSANALEHYDQSILEGFHLPSQVEPVVSNEIGLVTSHGGLPQEFVDENTGEVADSLKANLTSVIEAGTPAQQVIDQTGYVHKYAPGTGFYDAPGIHRPGGLNSVRAKLGAMIKPPSVRTASPLLALKATGLDTRRKLGVTDYASGAQNDPYNQGGSNTGGGDSAFSAASDGSTPPGGGADDGRINSGLNINTNIIDSNEAAGGMPQPSFTEDTLKDGTDGPSYFSDDMAGEGLEDAPKKGGFPWLIFLGVGAAATGFGLMVAGNK